MKKVVICLAIVSLFAATAFAANDVRISAVYGAGGNSGAVYNQDFVELFNAGPNAVNLSGWSIQYGSATGNNTTGFGTCTNCMTIITSGTIQPCSYFLIGLATGTNGIALPVVPDALGLTNLSGTVGKVGIMNINTASAVCPDGANMIDLFGYGTSNCNETAATAALSVLLGATRNSAGMIDTDNNSADFTVGPVAAPRNSTSPVNLACQEVGTESATWGAVKDTYK